MVLKSVMEVKEGKVFAAFKTVKQMKEVKRYLIEKTGVKIEEGEQYRPKLNDKEEIVTGLYEESCGKQVSVGSI